VIHEAYESDPLWAAAAEYGAEFRTDVEQLLTLEALQACIEPGLAERRPEFGFKYFAFVDPSGGSATTMSYGALPMEPQPES
jgi:hypothetical protein